MRTSADLGSLRSQKQRWKQACRTGAIIVSLIVFCSIVAGVIGCGEKSSEVGKLPEIVSFQANPPANEGGPVNYTFEVKNASKIVLIEAGETIKEIAGPSSGIYKGAATGQVPSAVLTSDNATLDAVLEASNDYGKVDKQIMLSGSQLQSASMLTVAYPAYPVPLWITCPTGCNCMTPAAAAALNLTYQCSPGHVCGLSFQSFALKYCYGYQPCWVYCNCLYDYDVQTCASPLIQCSSTPCGAPGVPPSNPSGPTSEQHCYHCPWPSWWCLTAAEAADPSGWYDYTDPSACKCSVNPDKWCYHKKPFYADCDNTTGCTCWPDSYINNQCAGQNMAPCPTALPCWPQSHCYHCPPDCMCLYDNDPQISSDNLSPCTSGNCKCIEGQNAQGKYAHCYKRPGT
jgi:hypothetical protein